MYNPQHGTLRKAIELWHELGRLERAGHSSRWCALGDLIRLRLRYGVNATSYLVEGLYRRELSWDEKLAYMPRNEFLEYSSLINPPRYQYVMLNKLVTHGVLTMFGIPTPPFYGTVDQGHGETWDGKPLRTPDDMIGLLERLGIDEVCFKLIEGLRSKGFYRVKIDRGSRSVTIHPTGEQVPLEDFWQTLNSAREQGYMGGYFVQGVVEQHPDVARFNPWSLNTVRSFMARDDDGEWYMHGAALRMGKGKTAVDSINQGGLGAAIDVATGRLRAGMQRQPDRPMYSKHPLTNVQIEGEILTSWPEAVELAERVGVHFPYLEMFACDIAFTPDGPVIIELGAIFGDPQPYFDMGLRPLMERLAARRRNGGE